MKKLMTATFALSLMALPAICAQVTDKVDPKGSAKTTVSKDAKTTAPKNAKATAPKDAKVGKDAKQKADDAPAESKGAMGKGDQKVAPKK
jgi:hypothetical protein